LLKNKILYGKKNFAERSKILLDTNLKIILLDPQNNFVRTLKIMSNAAKNFNILATGLNVLHILIVQQNYFSDLYPAKILVQQNYFSDLYPAKISFSRIILSMYYFLLF